MDVDKSKYIEFFTSQKVDAVLYPYYIHQSFVYTNEESISAYLNTFLAAVNRNIDYE